MKLVPRALVVAVLLKIYSFSRQDQGTLTTALCCSAFSASDPFKRVAFDFLFSHTIKHGSIVSFCAALT